VINAEGEYQASTKLVQAAEIIEQFPVAMQLRFLQTVSEVAVENNSTTIFPIPIDLFTPFISEGKPASPDARAKALKAATDAMVSKLPAPDAAAAALRDRVPGGSRIGPADPNAEEGMSEESDTAEV
ncbi:MAG: hypothetical protein ACKVIN_01325, partial [Longimicrobiales bacterium]